MNNCFIVNFGLWQEKLVFLAKFLARLSKALFTYPEEQLQSNIFERNSWKFEQFRITFEVFGTIAENLFQGWKNSNRCPGNRFWEKKHFQKRRIRYFIQFWAIFLILAKSFTRFAKAAIYVSVEVSGEKILEVYIIFHTFFGLWSKKRLVGTIFHGLSQLQSARPEAFFEEKSFSFKKKSYICSSVLEFEQFFCRLTKKVGVSKKQPINTEKTIRRKKLWKSWFFESFSDFE